MKIPPKVLNLVTSLFPSAQIGWLKKKLFVRNTRAGALRAQIVTMKDVIYNVNK